MVCTFLCLTHSFKYRFFCRRNRTGLNPIEIFRFQNNLLTGPLYPLSQAALQSVRPICLILPPPNIYLPDIIPIGIKGAVEVRRHAS